MNVVFLDFDGVITTLNSRWKLDLEKMKLVKRICDETNAKIVITSSWRQSDLKSTIKYITDTSKYKVPVPFLMPELVIGITPTIYGKNIDNDKYCYIPRGVEIQCYLDKYSIISNYVILDDDSDMLYTQASHFIKTDTYEGITEKNVLNAIKILNNETI